MSHGPQDIPGLEYVVNVGAALIGGAVRFVKEWRDNFQTWSRPRAFLEGALNGLYAGFTGLLTFWLLYSWKVDPYYSAFASGLMGHMGPEGLSLFKDMIVNGLRTRSPNPATPKD